MILLVYLGHGMFHPVVAALFFSKSVFGRGLELPNSGTTEKKWRTSIVERVSHSLEYTKYLNVDAEKYNMGGISVC